MKGYIGDPMKHLRHLMVPFFKLWPVIFGFVLGQVSLLSQFLSTVGSIG